MNFITDSVGNVFSTNSDQSLLQGPAEISSHWIFYPHLHEFGRHTQFNWESICLLRALDVFGLSQLPLPSAEDSSLVEEAFHILLSNTYHFICYFVKDMLWGPDWEFSLMEELKSLNASSCCLQLSSYLLRPTRNTQFSDFQSMLYFA